MVIGMATSKIAITFPQEQLTPAPPVGGRGQDWQCLGIRETRREYGIDGRGNVASHAGDRTCRNHRPTHREGAGLGGLHPLPVKTQALSAEALCRMKGITLGAGALLALDRNHRGVIALLARSRKEAGV